MHSYIHQSPCIPNHTQNHYRSSNFSPGDRRRLLISFSKDAAEYPTTRSKSVSMHVFASPSPSPDTCLVVSSSFTPAHEKRLFECTRGFPRLFLEPQLPTTLSHRIVRARTPTSRGMAPRMPPLTAAQAAFLRSY